MALVNVSPVKKLLQIFDKQLIFLCIILLSPLERQSLVKGYFCKTQATSRIPVMTIVTICKTKQKLLGKGTWEQSRLEQDRETRHFTGTGTHLSSHPAGPLRPLYVVGSWLCAKDEQDGHHSASRPVCRLTGKAVSQRSGRSLGREGAFLRS